MGPTGRGEVARVGCFICLKLQCDKVSSTLKKKKPSMSLYEYY